METEIIIRNFLFSIKPDIETIDGGCEECVTTFVNGINEKIEKFGLKFVHNGLRGDYYFGIDLIEL